MQSVRIPILAGALALGACSQSSTSPPGGPALQIAVAPLELPLMSDACYELTVWNRSDPDADGAEVVWTQPSLCASQYGGDGGIRFTGICDASAPDGHNAIRLVLNDVYTNGDAPDGDTLTAGSDYINPCPAPTEDTEDNGCVLSAPCDQNQDSRITFDLTVMRQVQDGFFDTVVRFQDVFCAAKLDCVDQNNAPLTYLYDDAAQADGPTAVLGFTCLGGSGGDVFMYLDDLVVTCGNETATVDPSEGPGLVGHTESGASPILFAAAVNNGAGFQGARYWNVLLGLSPRPGATCTLTTRGTASETALTGSPFETKPHTRYPYIDWDVTLSDGTNGGAPTCTRQPLNGGNGVATEYTGIDEPESFEHVLMSAPELPTYVRPCPEPQLQQYGSPTSLAGSPTVSGQTDGTGAEARFSYIGQLLYDQTTGTIAVVDSKYSTRLTFVTPAGVATTVPTSHLLSSGIGFDADGGFWYSENSATVGFVRLKDGQETAIHPAETNVHGATVAPDGYIYASYAHWGSDCPVELNGQCGGLDRIDPATGATTRLFEVGDITSAGAVAASKDAVYVGEANYGKVYRYDLATGAVTTLDSGFIVAIGTDSDGNVYLGNGNKVQPNNTPIGYGFASGTYGLAVDGAKNVYRSNCNYTMQGWACEVVRFAEVDATCVMP